MADAENQETTPAKTEEDPKKKQEEEIDLSVEPDKVPKPDKAELDKKIAEVEVDIKTNQSRLEAIREKLDELSNRGKATGAVAEGRAVLRTIRAEKDKILQERQVYFQQRDAQKAAMDQMVSMSKNLRSELKFTNPEDIDKQIKSMQHKQSTSSMSLNEEKNIIKEIETLKSMKKTCAQYATHQSKIDADKESNKNVSNLIAEKNKELAAVNVRMDQQRALLDKLQEGEGANREIIPALIRERENIRKAVDECFNGIRALRTDFREKNNQWYSYSKWLRAKRNKEYELEKIARQAAWEEKQRLLEEEEAKKIPYEEEMALCDFLVAYLGRISDAKEEAKEEAKVQIAHLDGFQPVNREQEDFMVMGAGTKKDRKKKGGGKAKKKAAKKLMHGSDTIETFGLLDLTPPTNTDDIAASLEAVKAKKEFFKSAPRPTKEEREAKKAAASKAANANKPKAAKKQGEFKNDEAAFPTLGGGAKPKADKPKEEPAEAEKSADAEAAADEN